MPSYHNDYISTIGDAESTAFEMRAATMLLDMRHVIHPLPKANRTLSPRRMRISSRSNDRDSDKPSRQQDRPREGRFSAVLASTTALLGAIIGGMFTLWATDHANTSQESARLAQIQEERNEQQRTLKQEAYLGFLDALNTYAATSEFESCAAIQADRRALYPACKALVMPDDERYLALISARDQVFLYGSQEAIDIANSFVLQIQDISRQQGQFDQVAIDECNGKADPGLTGVPGNGTLCQRYRAMADAFRNASNIVHLSDVPNKFPLLVCRELNAIPRSSCE